MKDFVIVDTMMYGKNEDIMYVTFVEHNSIREIHKRVAELRNDDITIHNFCPPQFWERYSYLGKYCMEIIDKDKDMKTMLRFNDKDIKVLVKNRRFEEQYRIVPMADIEKVGKVPKFDHSIIWRRRTDHPRIQPKPVSGKICAPSKRGSEIQRQRSSESVSASAIPAKRQKQDVHRMSDDESI